jgi:hypothetical protein
MSTSPIQSVINESLGAVIGNLITEYASPPETEVRHYYLDVGNGDDLSCTIGLRVKHSQGTYGRYIPAVAGTQAPGYYEEGAVYPYITLYQEYFTRRNHMSYEGDGDESCLMGNLTCVEHHKVKGPDDKWKVEYARTLYHLKVALVQPYANTPDEQHATIQIEVAPGASPKFQLLTSYDHPPPHFTVREVQPQTCVVGKPMVAPVRKSQ